MPNIRASKSSLALHGSLPSSLLKLGSSLLTVGGAVGSGQGGGGGWLVPMLHGVKHGYDALDDPSSLMTHLAHVSGRGDVWVAPFGDVLQYKRCTLPQPGPLVTLQQQQQLRSQRQCQRETDREWSRFERQRERESWTRPDAPAGATRVTQAAGDSDAAQRAHQGRRLPAAPHHTRGLSLRGRLRAARAERNTLHSPRSR